MTLRCTQPLRVGSVVLILVQHVRVERSRACGGVWLQASAEPRVIVAGEGGRWRAFDLHGAALALGPLVEEVGGLADAIAREHPGKA